MKEWEESKINKKIFWVGLFLLPSSFFFSFLLFFISAITSIKNNFKEVFKDSWNVSFLFSGIFLTIISFTHSEQIDPLNGDWDKYLSFIGLFNWIPQILLFIGLQQFLKSKIDRKIGTDLILAGSIPIFISAIGQYWFNMTERLEAFNGLIIWFQGSIEPFNGINGLFSNPNYMGGWLSAIWPLSLAGLINKNLNKKRRLTYLFFLILSTVFLILTTSRNAWGGLILLIPLMTGVNFFIRILFLFSIISVFIFLFQNLLNNFNFENLLPKFIINEFQSENFTERSTRIDIFQKAIYFILQKPLNGWGAGTFPILYFSVTQFKVFHSHNLILELALNYGIPAALTVITPILLVIFFSFEKIFKYQKKEAIDIFNRAWFSSFFVLFCLQTFDIQYFDGRISILFWILLAGLKEIIQE